MQGFDSDRLIEALTAAETPADRFAALTQGLAQLGLDTINYGFFDLRAAELMEADVQFLTTMRDDWMDYYADRNLHETDSHVLRARAGGIMPYVWGESSIPLVAPEERGTASEAVEAGLRSALCVPLASPLDPFSPVGAITFGSSMREREFRQVTQEHGATLISLAHLFHNASIRQIWSERSGQARLSARERDCLQYLADGKRHDAIAHALGLARVTVEVHLRAARVKLNARTPGEAIAKALLFGEIRHG